MAPSPTSDLLLLKEHEYYNTGDIRLVLPFLQDNEGYSSSSERNILLWIIVFVIVGLFISKRKSWMRHSTIEYKKLKVFILLLNK
ncbi:unnamed protein product [Debaryomyces fabryi]|nr:unnamed protein product [Debaryomyces fabryi]